MVLSCLPDVLKINALEREVKPMMSHLLCEPSNSMGGLMAYTQLKPVRPVREITISCIAINDQQDVDWQSRQYDRTRQWRAGEHGLQLLVRLQTPYLT
ncbi:TPA: hypothetical protein JD264_25700 [Serratia fonticola]|nr:hypothetical protein [Serratia fonticola]HAU5567169.1 hypothetical protein [Serratia fonticola]